MKKNISNSNLEHPTELMADTTPPVKTQVLVRPPFIIAAGTVLFLAIAFTPSYVLYNKYQEAQAKLANPQAMAQENVNELLTKVGKLMELPIGESPTVATVTDPARLEKQAFFIKAQKDDKLIIYTKAKKAILYRPSANKIIEVAPVNLAGGQTAGASTQADATPAQTFKVAIYNGTNTSGLTDAVEDMLKEKITNVTIGTKKNAKKKDYTKNIVVDVKGTNKVAAEQLAKQLNADVSALPEGEDKPDADFLVIVGEKVEKAEKSPTPKQ